MAKLKNTTQNKLLVLGGTVALGYFIGSAIARTDDKKMLSIAGAFIGLLVAQGVMSNLIEENKNK